MMRNGLLISNSTCYGMGYLDHVVNEICDLLGSRRKLLFIPFAQHDQATATETLRHRFAGLNYSVRALDEYPTVASALSDTEAVFIGGGNTFRLLHRLYETNLVDALRKRVNERIPYIGSSAGSIVACPTLKTTKDMPVAEPRSFAALNLVPFQISPHYLDPDPNSTHMGETQEQRIGHYHEDNDLPVVGLREGSFLRVQGNSVIVKGMTCARVFRKSHAPVEREPGSHLEDLLQVGRFLDA